MKTNLLKAFAAVCLIASAVFAYVFIPNHETLGRQTLDVSINDNFKLVGHRIHSTDPDAGKRFGYFVLSSDDTIDDQDPFLVTSDPFLRIEQTGENTLKLETSGRIYQYTNDLWTPKENGQLHHWYVSLESNYTR